MTDKYFIGLPSNEFSQRSDSMNLQKCNNFLYLKLYEIRQQKICKFEYSLMMFKKIIIVILNR